MIPLMTALPENSNDGYVAAAYIVFFALILVYVAIMAIRLSRVEREVRELRAEEREKERETV
jgi:CcmD family protein